MEFVDLGNIFKSYSRKSRITNIVLHETCGATAVSAIATLTRLKIGVHFIIDYDGTITQCVDPFLRTDHAKGMNEKGIGIEIVNPYAPKFIKHDIGYKYIKAMWWTWCPDKADRRYVLPFPAQRKSMILLVDHICEKYNVPFKFPTAGFREKIPADKVGPGIVAHRDFGTHSDGRYPLDIVKNNAVLRSTGVVSAIY